MQTMIFSAMLLLVTACAVADESFRLPVGAVATETGPDGKGWTQNGIIPVTFVAARQSFEAAIRAYGWSCVHSIPLGDSNDKVLVSWRRGCQELTLMLWRIDVDVTGFSWGLKKEGKNGEKKQ